MQCLMGRTSVINYPLSAYDLYLFIHPQQEQRTGVVDRCLYANGRGLINLTQINLKQENRIEALKENRLMLLILRKSLNS